MHAQDVDAGRSRQERAETAHINSCFEAGRHSHCVVLRQRQQLPEHRDDVLLQGLAVCAGRLQGARQLLRPCLLQQSLVRSPSFLRRAAVLGAVNAGHLRIAKRVSVAGFWCQEHIPLQCQQIRVRVKVRVGRWRNW